MRKYNIAKYIISFILIVALITGAYLFHSISSGNNENSNTKTANEAISTDSDETIEKDTSTDTTTKSIEDQELNRSYKIKTDFSFTEINQITEEGAIKNPISIKDEIQVYNNDFIRHTTDQYYEEVFYEEYKIADEHIVYDNYCWLEKKETTTINDLFPIILLNYISNNMKDSVSNLTLSTDILNQLFQFESYHLFINLDVKDEIAADITVNENGYVESLAFETDNILAEDNVTRTLKYNDVKFKMYFEYELLSEVVFTEAAEENLIKLKYNNEFSFLLKEYLNLFGDDSRLWPNKISLERMEKRGIQLNYLSNCNKRSYLIF